MNDLEHTIRRVERALVDVVRDLAVLEAWAPGLHDEILAKVEPYFKPRQTISGIPV